MRDLRYLDKFRVPMLGHKEDIGNVFFIIPRKSFGFYQVVATNSCGWDHVSICLLDQKGHFVERTLKWEEMCEVKQLFFAPDEAVIQIHPSDNINIDDSNYALDLWKPKKEEMRLPNPNLVGKIKKYPNKQNKKENN